MDNAFGEALGRVRNATEVFETEGQEFNGDLPELFEDVRFSPEVFAQILMNHIPCDDRIADKVFWLKVAEYMGPDYVSGYRLVGGFMNKVNEF